MCLTCGCGSDHVHVEGDRPAHWHTHADGTRHAHDVAHEHTHDHTHGHTHDYAHAHDHAHDPAAPRRIQVERDLLAHNDGIAQLNRDWFARHGILALNLVSSPGSGKTTLLVRTIEQLAGRLPVAVIEGDQQTSFDAERIRASGAPAIQINTGQGCHLDAAMIVTALGRLAPADDSVLMIENVGNLVCPAGFDLGEAHKVVVLSVTEGEDKPLKYPDMFHAASLMLLNKTDLLPYLDFDVDRCIEYARRVNPAIEIIPLSATRGTGMVAWLAWITRRAEATRHADTPWQRTHPVAAL